MILLNCPEINENKTTEELKAQGHKGTEAQRLIVIPRGATGVPPVAKCNSRFCRCEALRSAAIRSNPYGSLDRRYRDCHAFLRNARNDSLGPRFPDTPIPRYPDTFSPPFPVSSWDLK